MKTANGSRHIYLRPGWWYPCFCFFDLFCFGGVKWWFDMDDFELEFDLFFCGDEQGAQWFFFDGLSLGNGPNIVLSVEATGS